MFESFVAANVGKHIRKILISLSIFLVQIHNKTPHRLNVERFQEVFESWCV